MTRSESVISLPNPVTSLVGRAREVEAVLRIVNRTGARLLTLTGPGGVGKTRLAIHAATIIANDFDDGAVFVDLSSLADGGRVAAALAGQLRVPIAGTPGLEDRLIHHLQDRHMLIVLDNFEHVMPARRLLAALLANCHALTFLVTSREVLRLDGEYVFPVPPLSLPDVQKLRADEVGGADAVDLFVERASALRDGFALSDANAAMIAKICWRLDGLPLAIELAAARVAHLTPGDILARLGRRLDLLTAGAESRPPRQQTIRATIAWSYDLLEPGEKTVFRRISVFQGGFGLDAADFVCGESTEATEGREVRRPAPGSPASSAEMVDRLSSLVDKSLIRLDPRSPGESRYVLLDTMRDFGIERLTGEDEEASTRWRHVRWCLDLAGQAASGATGAGHAAWFDRLEREHDNLRAALDWSTTHAIEDDESALRLAVTLWRFWKERGHLEEGSTWLKRVLAATPNRVSALGAKALLFLGHSTQDEHDLAKRYYAESLEIAEAVNDERGMADALGSHGREAFFTGDYREAANSHRSSLDLYRRIGSDHGVAFAAFDLGILARVTGDHAEAKRRFDEAATTWTRLGDALNVAFALRELGRLERLHGRPRAAADLLSWSLRQFQKVGFTEAEAGVLYELGMLAALNGAPGEAMQHFRAALDIFGPLRLRDMFVAETIEGVARVALGQGQPDRAVRLWSAMAAWRVRVGSSLPEFETKERDRLLARARQDLDRSEYESHWMIGQTMDFETAVEHARTLEVEEVSRSAPATETASPEVETLTPREREVLVQLAGGLTDQQIAIELRCAKRTVTTHVARILDKLDVDNRAAAAATAVRLGIASGEIVRR